MMAVKNKRHTFRNHLFQLEDASGRFLNTPLQLRNLTDSCSDRGHGKLSSLNNRTCQQPYQRTASVDSAWANGGSSTFSALSGPVVAQQRACHDEHANNLNREQHLWNLQFSALSGHERQTQRRECKPCPRKAPCEISTGKATIGFRNCNCETSTVFCTSRPEYKSCITTGKTNLSKNSTTALSGSTTSTCQSTTTGVHSWTKNGNCGTVSVFCNLQTRKPVQRHNGHVIRVHKTATVGSPRGCTVWTATTGLDTTWSKEPQLENLQRSAAQFALWVTVSVSRSAPSLLGRPLAPLFLR